MGKGREGEWIRRGEGSVKTNLSEAKNKKNMNLENYSVQRKSTPGPTDH